MNLHPDILEYYDYALSSKAYLHTFRALAEEEKVKRINYFPPEV